MTHGEHCWSFREEGKENTLILESDQVEADKSVFLHCQHVTLTYSDIVIQSSDTDVYIIAFSHK